ncbi:steroidogenic acute regulatory protein-like [Zeugodacus cucurbitae]|uniref:StAR-related lipid transfer protein 3 n=1 Tax=Zeugodacus cucurbitae TaxID=28588 RepID=A0A0A1XIE6_ZEUCU|nr:steroidogenic acute regulatory protein-like [Zeugodacus cucurbitae]XP_011177890.1 steroidogenic acute regulatory protein-like [Zeugodacus cucurbitae]XP_011177892.1 steroidogenic acute regulatory protein-like [Zeugodacus cucurbitae]XP_054089405.1 steroidogenic acute regulatory protein-like [Zeugodacus cucurbitae]
MSVSDADEIRSAAELLITSSRQPMSYRSTMSGPLSPNYDMSRTHSINLITEEFLGGYMQDGRMSVVRRFFCLFVLFDLFFVSLLWLICIMITGDNIFQAFQKQIVHYTFGTSLFDVVGAAICRFVVLTFFYALLYINHWIIIALSTSGSCLFLISKVFVYDWVDSRQQVFEVILIITSFVLAWGEAWFLDCRVIPQERHARSYFSSITTPEQRSPMMAPFLASQPDRNVPESIFYSPLETLHNSDDDDDDEQDEEYHQMALDCVRRAHELFESSDWKVEKVTSKGDTIRSTQRDKLGKIYRLTGRIKYPPKALMEELFYKIESVPKWNPTLLESKIVHKINSYTDITYQASVGGGGGMVKSRDFINLRCWRLFRNGKMCEESDNDDGSDSGSDTAGPASVSTVSDDDSVTTTQPSSVESNRPKFSSSGNVKSMRESGGGDASVKGGPAFNTLSKSLGAKDFSTIVRIDADEPPPFEDDTFEDAHDNVDDLTRLVQKEARVGMQTAAQESADTGDGAAVSGALGAKGKNRVYLSAAISIDYAPVPPTTKYIRGENLVAGFALHEIAGKSDACIFDWILCLDLKGYIPRYVLETAYTTFMNDYMKYLRKYVAELRTKRKRVSRK